MVQANILKITQVEKYQGLKTTSHLVQLSINAKKRDYQLRNFELMRNHEPLIYILVSDT